MFDDTTPTARSEQWAEAHFGLVTLPHALSTGMTVHQVKARLRAGRWIRLGPGVYRVRGAPLGWQQDLLAACLTGPPGTVASHVSAAALHGLLPPSLLPHVTVPRGTSGRMRLAKVHRGDIDGRDLRVIRQTPCTAPARTLVDCAAVLDRETLHALVDDAFCRRIVDIGSVHAAAERAGRHPGRPGTVALRETLEAWEPGIRPGSPAEVRLLRLLHEWGYPAPTPQLRIYDAAGQLVAVLDVGWESRRFGLEYDGERFHGPRQWGRDELRYARLRAAGVRVLAVDKYDLLPGRRRFRDELARAWRAAGEQQAS